MDYQKALADGHSPEDVMGELARRGVKMNYKQALADGHDAMEVLREMNSREPGRGKRPAPAAARQASLTQGAAPWKKTASKIYTPILEGLGAAGGAALGAAAGAPTGPGAVLSTTGGAGLGYAAGKRLASMGDELLGIGHDTPQPQGLAASTVATAKDVLTGATVEAGGQVVGHAAGAAANRLSALRRVGAPLSNKLARTRAGEFLESRTTPVGAADTAARQRNKLATTQLRSRTGIDRPSLAQESGGMNIAATEQAYASQDTAVFGQQVATRDATISAQARKHVADTIPGQRGGETIANKVQSYAASLETNAKAAGRTADAQAAKLAAPKDAQPLGEDIVSAVEKAREPYTAATQKAYAEVPDYPIPADNFTKHAASLRDQPMEKKSQEVVHDFLQYAQQEKQTTQGLQAIDKTLTRRLRDPATDPTARHYLSELQKSLRADFDAMGEAAEKGDVALHDGRLVVPSKLRTEVADLEKRLATERGKQAGVDVDAMRKALMQSGDSSAMRQVAEKPESYTARLTQSYQRKFPGQPLPSVSTTDPKMLTEMEQGITARRTMLEALQPAEDVAKKYAAARRTAKVEFDKFTRGPLEKVFKRGNEATGRALPSEQVPRQFATESGADRLIDAVGQPQAAKLMRDHFAVEANRLLDRPPAQLAKWVKSRAAVLRKYGLYDEFSSLARVRETVAQSQAALDRFNKSAVAKALGAEPERAIEFALGTRNPERVMRELKAFGKGDQQYLAGLKVALRDHILQATEVTARDALGANKTSLAKTDKLIGQRFDRAMRVLYSPKEIQALKDYAAVTEMLSRNKNVSASGNSTTVEKMMGGIKTGSLFDRLTNSGRYMHINGGLLSGIKNFVIGALKGQKDYQIELIDHYVKEALIDPVKAKQLLDLVRGQRSAAALSQIKAQLAGMATGAAARTAMVAATAGGGGEPEPEQPVDDAPTTVPEPRVNGGPVTPGKQYITGEKRPEILMNADGSQQMVGATGPQIITPQQPGVVIPFADTSKFNDYIKQQGWGLTGDYDYRGYYDKHGSIPERGKGHLNDEFKLPNHFTFSDGSKYSGTDQQGGKWVKEKDGSWTFYASEFNLKNHSAEELQEYFAQHEKGNKLVLPRRKTYGAD